MIMENPTVLAAEAGDRGNAASPGAKAAHDFIEGLRRWELWVNLGWHDIRQRYRRSQIGPFWLTLTTGILVGTLGFLYAGIFRQTISNYLPFLTLGFIVWGLISSLILEGCSVFIASQGVIRQLKSPLSAHVFQLVWRNLIIFGHTFLVYIVVALVFDIRPGPAALLAIPGLALLCLNGVWVGLLLGMLSARFRDIPTIITNVVQILFFLTPIIWRADQVPNRVMFVKLNPFYHLVEIVRSPLLGQVPPWSTWLAVLMVTCCGYALALAFFVRFRSRVAFWV
jgi:ABC-type polysaccharide/polyol phosphate export permease